MRRSAGPFLGSIAALPTPFVNGTIDFAALLRLIERQIEGGTDGLVVGGTTGEAAVLSTDERMALFEYVVGAARGRVPVVAGVGSSDTRVACELARSARAAGADGLLAMTPAYNRPTQAGLERHFAAIVEASSLPLALYNIPTRTGVDLLPATAAAIGAAHPSIVAIKEASTSLERVRALVALDTLAVLCGDDAWIADCMQAGAAGAIGVVANLVPDRVAQLIHAFDDDTSRAEAPALVEAIAPLVAVLSVETNPAPLKAALEILELCGGELRLPLVSVAPESRAQIHEALAVAGLTAR